jgi:Flp pilus assembly protein TadG
MTQHHKPELARTGRRCATARQGSKQRGVYAMMFAVLLIPLIATVGCAVDYARVIQYKSDLQNAVDEAALAGAAAFTDSSAATITNVSAIATNYFKRAILPASLSVGAPTVTPNANGSLPPAGGGTNYTAYTVSVSATAKIANTLFSIFVPNVSVSATGVAGNPRTQVTFPSQQVNTSACDGNSAYMYVVPQKADGSYDYANPPPFTVATSTTPGNYYLIGSSNGQTGTVLPTVTANQHVALMLQNQTNQNSTNGCGVTVTGANSYGAPNLATQAFYSSLITAGGSPSDQSNYTYTATVVTKNSAITSVAINVPPTSANPSGLSQNYSGSTLAPSPYNVLASYVGQAGCVTKSTSTSGQTTTTVYSCTTQYRTSSASSQANCSLYIQTGVTQTYLNNLTSGSSAPSGAAGQCFSPTGGGSPAYASPTCAQLGALANNGNADAAVYWWDDGGGVGQGEQYYGPSAHCSGATSGGPGYGEDCQYKNNFFTVKCAPTGVGNPSGSTQVVLGQ